MNFKKKEFFFSLLSFLVIFFTLILNIYSLNFSYLDLGIFINSQDTKTFEVHQRYYILYLINNLFDFDKKNFGIFLIFSQFFSFVIIYLHFYKNSLNKYLSFFFLINLNFLYAIFFDFHFEFYLLLIILIFVETKKNTLQLFIIFILPFIKDIYFFISIGMYIYLCLKYKKNHKFFLFIFLLSTTFLMISNSKNILNSFSNYSFDYKFLFIQFFYFLIILFPFFIFFKKNILENKIFLVGLPYLIFLIAYNNPNYFKFYYHYLIPITFVFFLAFYKFQVVSINKIIIIFIVTIHFSLSPLIGFPVSLIFKDTNIYYKNILTIANSSFVKEVKNKKNNIAYIQNNFFSPILYDYFKNVKVLDDNIFSKISIGDVIILNMNKNLFINDKKCKRNIDDTADEICIQFIKKIRKEFKILYEFKGIVVFENIKVNLSKI
jgi:hypothetical protein